MISPIRIPNPEQSGPDGCHHKEKSPQCQLSFTLQQLDDFSVSGLCKSDPVFGRLSCKRRLLEASGLYFHDSNPLLSARRALCNIPVTALVLSFC
jgi:hypothetical protein